MMPDMTSYPKSDEKRIKFPVQDVGGDIEDEANARAGEIIKSFAQSDDNRKRIYESLGF